MNGRLATGYTTGIFLVVYPGNPEWMRLAMKLSRELPVSAIAAKPTAKKKTGA
jgi:hypothetical protein